MIITKIGIVTKRVIEMLKLNIEINTPIFISESNYKHMLEKHQKDFVRFAAHLDEILAKPDFVGLNPLDKSLEYIKEFKVGNEYVKVAVRMSGGGKCFVRSMYSIPDYRVETFLKIGRFKKLD